MARRRKLWWVVGGVAVAVVVALVAVYFVFIRSVPPPRVSTEAAQVACQRTAPEVESLDTVDGNWTVLVSGADTDVEDGSFVGYRVNEELTAIGANTAVGRTKDVDGSVTLEGTTVSEGEITAQLTGLESDDARRDGQVANSALQTDQFPSASFTLTEPIELGAIPDDGEVVTETGHGELTLHGVTQPIDMEVEAQRLGSVIAVVGHADITLADYSITPPKFGPVVSVDDHGELEVQLCLEPASP